MDKKCEKFADFPNIFHHFYHFSPSVDTLGQSDPELILSRFTKIPEIQKKTRPKVKKVLKFSFVEKQWDFYLNSHISFNSDHFLYLRPEIYSW